MDNSDLRRGRPTCHKQFDDATAILAGDGLLTMAFGVLADPDAHGDLAVRSELVAALAARRGPAGMVGGQMIDLIAETTPLDIGVMTRLERMNGSSRFVEAARSWPRRPVDLRTALALLAHDLGLALQIADDLLDDEGDAAETETVGATHGRKATFAHPRG